MRSVAIGVVVLLGVLPVLVALALAPPATAAPDQNIERVVVTRSADDRLTFRLVFADAVSLGDKTRVQVAIDTDRDADTGIDGLEYSLDWTRYPSLLQAVDGEEQESEPESLRFEHSGAVVMFSIAAADIGSPERFDFYAFIEDDGVAVDIAPVDFTLPGSWTYPREPLAPGEPYTREVYIDDDSLAEGDWGDLLGPGVIVGGLFVLGALVAVVGWGVERARKRRRPDGDEAAPTET